MKQIVTIKSFPNGIHVILDPDCDFEQLYVTYAEKFRDSAKFFGDAKIVMQFSGRVLSDLEERALVEAIGEYTNLTVLCVMENDKETNELYLQAAEAFSPTGDNDSSVYKGTIHAGQHITSDGSIVILGDVNPGASVEAAGSVIVLGTVYGEVFAGCKNDPGKFVAAIDYKTDAVKLGDKSCKIFSKSSGLLRKIQGPRIVYIFENEIYCEEITKEFLSDLPF